MRKRKGAASATTDAANGIPIPVPGEVPSSQETAEKARADDATRPGDTPVSPNGTPARPRGRPRRSGAAGGDHTRITVSRPDETNVTEPGQAAPRHHSAESIQGRDVEWLYRGFLARRFAGLLYGPSTVGKSTLERWFTACLTNGWPLPGGEAIGRENVLWITSEETPEDVVK